MPAAGTGWCTHLLQQSLHARTQPLSNLLRWLKPNQRQQRQQATTQQHGKARIVRNATRVRVQSAKACLLDTACTVTIVFLWQHFPAPTSHDA
jgi:hypothetical protein